MHGVLSSSATLEVGVDVLWAESRPPRTVHGLIPGTCDYALGYVDLAGGLKVTDFKIGRSSWIFWVGPSSS